MSTVRLQVAAFWIRVFMLVRLPIVFDLVGRSGTASGCRAMRARWIEREIPRVSESEALVAARWRTSSAARRVTECRVWGGGFYVRELAALDTAAFGKIGTRDHGGVGNARLARLMGFGEGTAFHAAFDALLLGRSPSVSGFGMHLDKVEASGEYDAEKSLERLFDTLLFVDGGLWRKIEEPKLRIDAKSRVDAKFVRTSVETNRSNDLRPTFLGDDHLARDIYFNMGDVAALADYLESEGFPPDVRLGDVEVPLPALFVFDAHRQRVLRLARDTSALAGAVAGDLDVATVETWIALRRELAAEGDPEAGSPDVLFPLVESIAEHLAHAPGYPALMREIDTAHRLAPVADNNPVTARTPR